MTLAKENGSHLVISPSELKFRFQLNKNIPITVSLHNPTSSRVAFKVKTTSPKKYCVRPSAAFIEPNGVKDVEIIMQAQKEYPPDLCNCRDKFLLQSVTVEAHVASGEVTSEMFDKTKNKDVHEAKLKVFLEGPPAPPSPIPESANEEEPLLSKMRAAQRLDDAKAEQDSHRKVVRKDMQTDAGSAGQGIAANGFSLLQLIVVALIAFLLGHYTS